MRRLHLLALTIASILSAQTTEDRTFLVRNAATEQEFNELALAALTVSTAKVKSNDFATRQLAVTGTVPQLQAAEWVLGELDRPASAAPPVSKRLSLEAKAPGDELGVFYLDPAASTQSVNELLTAVRTLSDIRYVGPYASKHAVALRGTPEQLDFAQWLLSPTRETPTYTFPREADPRENPPENYVRVFGARAKDVQSFNEVQTLIRTITDTRRVYPNIGSRTIFLRGSEEQADLSLWLTAQLDKDLPLASKSSSPSYTMRNGDIVRVFHYNAAMTQADYKTQTTALRTATGIRRFYPYESARTIAARGTPAQMTQLETLFQQ